MFVRNFKIFFLFVFGTAFLIGCATAPKKANPNDLSNQVTALEQQIAVKDQEIQDLRAQLDSQSRALPADNEGTVSSLTVKKSKYIRVEGVSVYDVQAGLKRAGFNPGPIDGRMGAKTKRALKEFQRRRNLSADGIVGEKTWALLKP